jgi:hypothetical protein
VYVNAVSDHCNECDADTLSIYNHEANLVFLRLKETHFKRLLVAEGEVVARLLCILCTKCIGRMHCGLAMSVCPSAFFNSGTTDRPG